MRRAILAVACSILAAGCGSSSGSRPPGTGAATAATATTRHLTIIGTPRYGSPSPSAPVLSGLVKVAYRNVAIDPNVIRVRAGSTVEWTNHDQIEHNVTSSGSGPGQIASRKLAPGATVRVRLTRPGVIHYECTIHPATMNGTIQVLR